MLRAEGLAAACLVHMMVHNAARRERDLFEPQNPPFLLASDGFLTFIGGTRLLIFKFFVALEHCQTPRGCEQAVHPPCNPRSRFIQQHAARHAMLPLASASSSSIRGLASPVLGLCSLRMRVPVQHLQPGPHAHSCTSVALIRYQKQEIRCGCHLTPAGRTVR